MWRREWRSKHEETGTIMETAVGLAIGFAGGVVLTVLGAILIVRFQRQRRELGYEIVSANVIIPKLSQPNPAARVVVRRSALEGREWRAEDPDEPVPVDEVYGFRVRLRNCGNTVLDRQAVRLSFDEGTKVILANIESGPELGDERVDITVTEGGRSVVVIFPFLNPEAEAVVSVQTVYNSTRSCQVVAAARGLRTFNMGKRRTAMMAMVVLCLLVPGGILLGLGTAGAAPETVTKPFQLAGSGLLIAAWVVFQWVAMSITPRWSRLWGM